MHYYHRWAENDKAKKAAARKMKSAQQETLEILSNFYATPTSQLKFILDAWNQVLLSVLVTMTAEASPLNTLSFLKHVIVYFLHIHKIMLLQLLSR